VQDRPDWQDGCSNRSLVGWADYKSHHYWYQQARRGSGRAAKSKEAVMSTDHSINLLDGNRVSPQTPATRLSAGYWELNTQHVSTEMKPLGLQKRKVLFWLWPLLLTGDVPFTRTQYCESCRAVFSRRSQRMRGSLRRDRFL
jgi:hypothetical protein